MRLVNTYTKQLLNTLSKNKSHLYLANVNRKTIVPVPGRVSDFLNDIQSCDRLMSVTINIDETAW